MVGFSLVCALFQGHLPDLTQALLAGGSEAVTLLLRLAGESSGNSLRVIGSSA